MGCSDAPCESRGCGFDYGHKGKHSWDAEPKLDKTPEAVVDMVNSPPHYGRGPTVECPHCGRSRVIECIEVIRWIKDMRLATAMKYLWRVAFGGKDNDREDIEKSRWYTQDWLNNEVK